MRHADPIPCPGCGLPYLPGSRGPVTLCRACAARENLLSKLALALAPREGAVFQKGPRQGVPVPMPPLVPGAHARHLYHELTRLAGRAGRIAGLK